MLAAMLGRCYRLVGRGTSATPTTGSAITAMLFVVGIACSSPASARASTLKQEADTLVAAAIANMAKIHTLTYDLAVSSQSIDGHGNVLSPLKVREERVACDHRSKKLKLAALAPVPRGYVADAMADIVQMREGSATSIADSLSHEKISELATPYPSWLWSPQEYLPSSPVTVSQDGDALVLTHSATPSHITCWLQRRTGCLLKYTVTDGTGAVYRTVVCLNWSLKNQVWVPGQITEEVRGQERGFRRTLIFNDLAVNPGLPAETFSSP